ncbi:MAG: SCO family protein [Planctomycetota bacterium]
MLAATATLLASSLSCAQILRKELPDEAVGVTVDEKLGETIPLGVMMTEADGRSVELSRYFNTGKPVVLVPVYFNCPLICPLTLDKLTAAFNGVDSTIGEDYNVVVLSFNPEEKTSHAIQQKILHTNGYKDGPTPEVQSGWGFHTADAVEIARVLDAVGYRAKRLDNGEYSHPLATIVLSPEGKVTRYLYGLDFPPEQLKYSLLEASEGKIAKSLGDVFAFQCFRYDPSVGKYTASAMAVMRIAGGLTVAFLVVLITTLLLGERVRRKLAAAKSERRERSGETEDGPTTIPSMTPAGHHA